MAFSTVMAMDLKTELEALHRSCDSDAAGSLPKLELFLQRSDLDMQTRLRALQLQVGALGGLLRSKEALAAQHTWAELAREANDPAAMVMALWGKATLLLLDQPPGRAPVDLCAQALALCTTHRLSLPRLRVLGLLAYMASMVGWHDRARQTRRMALLMASQQPDVSPEVLVKMYSNATFASAQAVLDHLRLGRDDAMQMALQQMRSDLDQQFAIEQKLGSDHQNWLNAQSVWCWYAGKYGEAAQGKAADPEACILPPLDAASQPGWAPGKVAFRRFVAALWCKDRGDTARALSLLSDPEHMLASHEHVLSIAIDQELGDLHAQRGEWQQACQAQERAQQALARRNDEALLSRLGALLDELHADQARASLIRTQPMGAPLKALQRLALQAVDGDTASLNQLPVAGSELADQALAAVDAFLRHAELDLLRPEQFESLYLAELIADGVDRVRNQNSSAPLAIDEDLDNDLYVHSHSVSLQRLLLVLLTRAAQNAQAGDRVRVRTWRAGGEALVSITSARPTAADPASLRYPACAASRLGAVWHHMHTDTGHERFVLGLPLTLPLALPLNLPLTQGAPDGA